MGSWNGTCMISNLPIRAGEPVVGYTIEYFSWKDSKNYSGTCYPFDRANPFGLSFHGSYNDYGGIENVDENGIAIKYLLHLFNESNSEELLNDIERDNRTITLERTNRKNGVGLVMINKHIYDRLIASHIPNEYDINVEMIVEGFDKIRESVSKRKRLLKSLDEEDNISRLFGNLDKLGIRVDILERKDYENIIEFVINQNDKNAEIEFAKTIRNDHIIRDMMFRLRKIWLGPSGKGAQNNDYKSHLILADAIKEHIFGSFNGPEEVYRFLLKDKDY